MLGARSLGGQGATLVCCIALFAFIGPFGTYDSIGPLDRVGYWAVAMGANWLVCSGAIVLALYFARAGSSQRRMLAIALAALVAAVPGAGVVFTAEALFRSGYADESGIADDLPVGGGADAGNRFLDRRRPRRPTPGFGGRGEGGLDP